MESASPPHIVVVGGGFAGLEVARGLSRCPVRITLLDRQNHHLFQPLLYQVATGVLTAPDIAIPIRSLVATQRNVTVLLADVSDIDREQKELHFLDGERLSYDYLVLAAGSRHTYFGHDDWEEFAPGLKTVADALELRERIFSAFEAAERLHDDDARRKLLTFVVVGGGPTGVELAGALAEIAYGVLPREYRHLAHARPRVVLVEAQDFLLSQLPPSLSRSAREQLEGLGVEVRTGARVIGVDDDGVILDSGRLESHTVLWGAGVVGVPLGERLHTPLHRSGRVLVMPDLTLPHDDKVYVAGDLAFLEQPDGRVVPALAPAAKQMGRLVAQNLQRALSGKPRRAFCYRDRGTLATIGRSRGVGVIGPLKLSGMVAWLAWLFVHLVFLVGFKSRILVLFEWIWSYVTFQRGARVLIEPAVLMGRLLASRHGAPTRGRLSHVEITASSAAPSSP